MISKKLLDELKVILKNDYDLILTDAQVSEIANSLVDYCDQLLLIKEANNT